MYTVHFSVSLKLNSLSENLETYKLYVATDQRFCSCRYRPASLPWYDMACESYRANRHHTTHGMIYYENRRKMACRDVLFLPQDHDVSMSSFSFRDGSNSYKLMTVVH